MRLPMASSAGFAFAKASPEPPHMKVSVAALAPPTPPDIRAAAQSMRDAIITAQHPEIRYDDVFHIAVKGKREALPVCHVKTDTLANN